jgi:hypothetical protein
MPKIIELPRRGAAPYFQPQFALSQIADIARRYSDDDSQVMPIGAAARQRGFYTRDEFLVVCAWKTRRTKTLVALNSAGDVQHATRAALRDGVSETRRIQALRALWGVDVRTASVFLHLADIDRWPILDVLALRALGVPERNSYSVALWEAYVAAWRKLRAQAAVDGRTLDRALWQWGKEHPPA